jgi:uncharacterized glyoxalase superfamily protein PhnB
VDVYPTLTYRDVRAALDWLANAFGLEPRVFDGGSEDEVHHAALMHGEGMVLVESERPEDLHGSHSGQGWVYVAVEDVDGHYERAKAAGVRVLNEPHDAIEGAQRGYSARDLEGNLWTFGTARPKR